VINKNTFHLNRCFKCQKIFKDKDPVYTISEGLFSNSDAGVFLVFTDLAVDPTMKMSVPNEIHFHKSCYLEIAGEDYVFESE
jgi:hypothetical protein